MGIESRGKEAEEEEADLKQVEEERGERKSNNEAAMKMLMKG